MLQDLERQHLNRSARAAPKSGAKPFMPVHSFFAAISEPQGGSQHERPRRAQAHLRPAPQVTASHPARVGVNAGWCRSHPDRCAGDHGRRDSIHLLRGPQKGHQGAAARLACGLHPAPPSPPQMTPRTLEATACLLSFERDSGRALSMSMGEGDSPRPAFVDEFRSPE